MTHLLQLPCVKVKKFLKLNPTAWFLFVQNIFFIVLKSSKFLHFHLEKAFYIFPIVYNQYDITDLEVLGKVNCQVCHLLNNAQCDIFGCLQEVVFNCSTLSSTRRLIMPQGPGGISKIQSYQKCFVCLGLIQSITGGKNTFPI